MIFKKKPNKTTLNELRGYINDALKAGRVIEEVQAPKSLVIGELEGILEIEKPTNLIVGELFGFPFRDSKHCAVISK